ncbi:hypothetical protein B8046_08955 [Klebsiella pneumoniae]|nr:hypothetical protein B8047_05550 [Klebsiella pneumoniae]OVJ84789.1 hypothetical protein B8046_08955 [Klebsiella pneumoniae]
MREILISESAWEEMTCLFAPSLILTRVIYPCKGSFLSLNLSKSIPSQCFSLPSPHRYKR